MEEQDDQHDQHVQEPAATDVDGGEPDVDLPLAAGGESQGVDLQVSEAGTMTATRRTLARIDYVAEFSNEESNG